LARRLHTNCVGNDSERKGRYRDGV